MLLGADVGAPGPRIVMPREPVDPDAPARPRVAEVD